MTKDDVLKFLQEERSMVYPTVSYQDVGTCFNERVLVYTYPISYNNHVIHVYNTLASTFSDTQVCIQYDYVVSYCDNIRDFCRIIETIWKVYLHPNGIKIKQDWLDLLISENLADEVITKTYKPKA